jgi:Pvc16 N-terminal domain
MIVQALNLIRSVLVAGNVEADLGNVADILSSNGSPTTAPLLISLVNIEENRVSRDPTNYVRGDGGTVLIKKNPAVHLNLTILFTSVRHDGGYELSLNDVQQVIGIFQNQHVFDSTTTPPVPAGIEKLILEMLSLNLEQLHQLWSMLGGKYYPSVAYRMRMVTIDSVFDQNAPLIHEIEANYQLKV